MSRSIPFNTLIAPQGQLRRFHEVAAPLVARLLILAVQLKGVADRALVDQACFFVLELPCAPHLGGIIECWLWWAGAVAVAVAGTQAKSGYAGLSSAEIVSQSIMRERSDSMPGMPHAQAGCNLAVSFLSIAWTFHSVPACLSAIPSFTSLYFG
jgi:hypothetical protein